MMFHIRHHHEPAQCIAHKPDEIKRVIGGMIAKGQEGTVEVKSFVIDVPGHNIFWVVDAPTIEALHDFLDSGLEWGVSEITPVADGLAAVEART